MGIRGLNYIVGRDPDLFQTISLHDTFLVIDGINISIWLYRDQEFCQKSVLNGDYSAYGRCVRHFFAQLKRCNIFPVVILDGGHEERKLRKTRERMQQRIMENDKITNVNFGGKDVFYPAQITEVFKDVMSEMNIFFCQDLLEADLNIAKTARFLNCPVISFDSDFYLENVKYVPFLKLQWKQVRPLKDRKEASTSSSKYFIKAEIFKRSKFHQCYGKLQNSFLPLLSFLLGNDYSESVVYDTFFRNLYGGINPNDLQQKISTLSTWFRNSDSPEIAVEKFCEEIPPESRERTRRELLRCLAEKNSREPSYLQQYIQHSLCNMTGDGAPSSELKKKIQVIEGSSEWLKRAAAYMSPNETDTNTQTALCAPAKMSIPDWILTQHIKGKTRNLMDLLHTQNFFFTLQMEQHFLTNGEATGSATDHTLTILQRILGILYHNHPKKDDVSITVYSRVGNRLDSQIVTPDPVFSNSSPILAEMPTLSLDERKKIAFDILKVAQVHETEIPDDWELFFLTLASWYGSDTSEIKTHALGCLIFSSIFVGVIDKKLGYHGTIKSVMDKYPEIWRKINSEKQLQEGNSKSSENFRSVYDKVELEDCVVALKHFIQFRERNHSSAESGSLFKPILHCFAQFQINIIMSEILNLILHLPFLNVKIADFYYGTLAYNIYFEIKKHNSLESFVKLEFKDMPTLQALFLSAVQVVKTLSSCKLPQQRKRKSRFSPPAENVKTPKLA